MNCQFNAAYGLEPDQSGEAPSSNNAARIQELKNFIRQYEALPEGSAKYSLKSRYLATKEELELLLEQQKPATPPPSENIPGVPVVRTNPLYAPGLIDKAENWIEKNPVPAAVIGGAVGILLLRKLFR